MIAFRSYHILVHEFCGKSFTSARRTSQDDRNIVVNGNDYQEYIFLEREVKSNGRLERD